MPSVCGSIDDCVLTCLSTDYDPEFGMGDQMFTDLNISRDLGKDYRAQLIKEGRKLDLVPEVMILQQSVWPFTSTKGKVTAVLPPSVRLRS